MLLRLDDLEKRIGDRVLFRGASAVVRARDRIGIVGPNGAGKTTLLRTLMGEEAADAGRVHRARGIRIGMLRQEIDPHAQHSVRQEAQTALVELDELEAELRGLETEMEARSSRGEAPSEALNTRYDDASARFAQGGGFERHARVSEMLAGLGFESEDMDRPLSSFSGGWLMRVELAKLLLSEPAVLLLDEPTNHLDLPSIQFFENILERLPGAVLVVSHDRTFLNRHSTRIVELDGHGGFTLYEGNYSRYVSQREERRALRLARKANQDREIAQTERFIDRFRAKATKARQVQSRIKALEKIERVQVEPDRRRAMRLKIPSPTRSGERVLSLTDLTKHYGEEVVYSGIDFSVGRGEKVALVGPNGAGKSTLLRIAAGMLDFEAGDRTLGHNVQLTFFTQHQLEALDPNATVLEELSREALTHEIPRLRGHLGAFLFTGDDVEKQISILSGGEKARVALAKLLLRPANFLILDEPTNHLDIEACEVLEEAFRAYEGTILFVSHDRTLINALASRVVEVVHGQLDNHLGNYDAYLERKARALLDRSGPSSETNARAVRPDSAPTTTATPTQPARLTHKQARMRDRERRKTREKTARRIEQLEAQIGEDEQRSAALNWKLGDPVVYRDAERTRALQSEQAALGIAIQALYREWERLSGELAALDERDED